MEEGILKACGRFTGNAAIKSIERYGEGHINDTFLVKTDENGEEKKYLFQRINDKVFKDVPRLMNNIKLVTEFARKKISERGGDADRESLTIIPTHGGDPYYYDGKDYYRMYKFIDRSITYQISEGKETFYQSALAFGRFALLIADFDANLLFESIPRFHDTRKRFTDLKNAAEENSAGRKRLCEKELEFAFAREDKAGIIVDKLASGEIPSRVTHNDTKLNNVLFDAESKKAIAVIDLDTIMAGSLCYDFGDSIRFGCNTAAEDERDLEKVNFDIGLFEAYAKGYLSELKGVLKPSETENLATGALMMTYECGMRFLEDFLRGDVYFNVSRENHNLDRARVQFRLLGQMEEKLPQMKEIINKYAG